MDRKVLFTALGKGKEKIENRGYQYSYALYHLDNQYYFSKYLFEALIEKGYDEIVFVGTSGSDWAALHQYVCEEIHLIENKERGIDDAELEENVELEVAVQDCSVNNEALKRVLSEKLKKLIQLRLREYSEGVQIKDISIHLRVVKDGENEAEIKEVLKQFFTMSQEIFVNQPGDEHGTEDRTKGCNRFLVDLDITHSYRSLPMFYYSMLDYTSAINSRVTLDTIYYAIFEKSDFKPSSLGKKLYPELLDKFIRETEVKKTVRFENFETFLSELLAWEPQLKNYKLSTEIVKLNQLAVVDEWVKATNDFVNYGYVEGLKNLIKHYADRTDKDTLRKKYQNLGKQIETISKKLGVVDVAGIMKDIDAFENALNDLQDDQNIFIRSTIQILTVFLNTLKNVGHELEGFEEGLMPQTVIAYNCCKWYLEHGQRASFIICSLETFLTFLMELFGYSVKNVNDYTKREHLKKSMVDITYRGLQNRNDYNQLHVLQRAGYFIKTLAIIRNAVAHSSSRANDADRNNMRVIFNIGSFEGRHYNEIGILREMTRLMSSIITYFGVIGEQGREHIQNTSDHGEITNTTLEGLIRNFPAQG